MPDTEVLLARATAIGNETREIELDGAARIEAIRLEVAAKVTALNAEYALLIAEIRDSK